jgi:choline-sulfatase
MDRIALLIAVVVIVSADGNAHAAPPSQRPNILFIFADDQCYETLASLGHTDIETPNLDRLSRRGTTFTHAYNMGSWSGAVCVASRCMLVTGRYLWNANRVYKTTEQERQAGRFWSEYMKQAGYDTYFTGKWHIRADAHKAFHVARHVRPGMPNQTPAGYNRPLAGKPDSWSPFDPKFGGFWKGGTHWSAVVANDAVDYLTAARNSKNPFFMYIAFNAPHDPRQSPKAYVEKYPLDRIKLPVNFQPEYPFKDAMGCGKRLRDEKLGPFPRTENSVKVHRQEYYAIITHMDAQIGRILDALDKSPLADNTYIFFTADHGLAVGHHGLFGKQNLYDHSVRVPFIAVGPGIESNRKIDAPIYLQDVMPTSLELAGVSRPDHVQFHSLLPLLKGETDESAYDALYGAYLQLQRSVTADGYKLILYPKIKKTRLYDLKDDPQEMNDLAADGIYQPIVKKLFAKLLQLQPQVGDKLDLKSVFGEL